MSYPDWEGSADLTALSAEELKRNLGEIVEEEKIVSYRRRVLHGKIDLIRAELVRRGEVSLTPEELARVLMGSEGKEQPG
ncbi:hypothetical protein BH24ACT20_BH24ACT20_02820 [soil metagenome]